MSAADSRRRGTLEERIVICRKCQLLLSERTALPWWRCWRWHAINREMRALMDSLEEKS